MYRHYDIDREHYHVVSVRVGRDGRKIGNYYEQKRVSAFMKEVAPRYGFSIAEKGDRTKTVGDLSEKARGGPFARFNPRDEVASQMRALYQRAIGYDFDSFRQLGFILEDMGLKVSCSEEKRPRWLTLHGLDAKGEPVTEVFSEAALGMPLYRMMTEAAEASTSAHPARKKEKERVQSLVRFAFDISRSEGHFVNILKGKGISVHFSRTQTSGDVFGATFVDHSTRTVFKASELRTVFSVRKMQEAVREGKWRKEERGSERSTYVSRSRAAARQDAVYLRNLDAGGLARLLTPSTKVVGGPQRGATGPDEKELRDKREAEKAGAMNADFTERRLVTKLG